MLGERGCSDMYGGGWQAQLFWSVFMERSCLGKREKVMRGARFIYMLSYLLVNTVILQLVLLVNYKYCESSIYTGLTVRRKLTN